MKRFVGLFVVVVFAISAGMAYGAPLKSETQVHGKGGAVIHPDGVIEICPISSPDICAVIYTCDPSSGGQNSGPTIGDPCKVQMQDGSNDVYEGTLLEIGDNNQGAKIDSSTQCPEE